MLCNLCRGSGWLFCASPIEFHRCPKCVVNDCLITFGPETIMAPKPVKRNKAFLEGERIFMCS